MRIRLIAVIMIIGSITLTASSHPRDSETLHTPIPPRTVTLNNVGKLDQSLGEIMFQVRLPFEVDFTLSQKRLPVQFEKVPFWTALEDIANRTDSRIAVRNGGRRIALEPRGKSLEISSVSGPFRTLARQVSARFDLELGHPTYSVQLDAHWEPRLPVFRMSAAPQITKATDDRGSELKASSARTLAPVAGFQQSFDVVRFEGLTRESKSIAVLSGHYTVTAAEEMLAFRFEDLNVKLPATLPAQAGVTASLRRFEKDEDVWEIEVELNYPGELPLFESFEEGVWLARNRLELIPPGGGKSFAPSDYQFLETGKRVVAIYRFKEDAAVGLVNPKAKGWSVVCEAPSPLREYQVPFELKAIPLP